MSDFHFATTSTHIFAFLLVFGLPYCLVQRASGYILVFKTTISEGSAGTVSYRSLSMRVEGCDEHRQRDLSYCSRTKPRVALCSQFFAISTTERHSHGASCYSCIMVVTVRYSI